jgi:hypothetical protein
MHIIPSHENVIVGVVELKEKELTAVAKNLWRAIVALDRADIEDEKLWSRYAEYLIAFMLTKQGQAVWILNERTDKRARSADIYLPEKDIRIEVKTGKYSNGAYVASFREGSQIKEGKFDYCVFVTYDENGIRECLIFTRDELMEVAEKPRPPPIARYPNNACILFRYGSLTELEKGLGKDALKIETELHTHPERFKNKWDKIFSKRQQ